MRITLLGKNMTERAKRLLVHLTWGFACVLLAYAALRLRVHIAGDELAQADRPDFQRWMAMRTLDAQLRDQREAHERAVLVLRHKDFRHTRLSGSEVVSIAQKVARDRGEDLSSFGDPQISLQVEDGRLVWHVAFYHVPVIPGAFFTIGVDDENRTTAVYPGL
jgi:hypothetical protein